MKQETIETDVLIIGGGGAGFRAAIGAREKGAEVVLLSKGPLARCGATPMAGADFTVDGLSLSQMGFDGEPRDSKETFFSDIVHQGYYMNNQKLVEQYVRAAPDRLKELIAWGIKIIHSEERAIFTSGVSIMDALLRRARSIGVRMAEDVMLLDLVTGGGKIEGALALDIKSGEFIRFKTKAVVMATGGWHKAFWPNTGMRDLSGEGVVIAHRAGADIGNMEFITFACNVLLSPMKWLGSIATYMLHTTVGGELTNQRGEAFLDKYDPYVVQKGTTMEWNKSFISFAATKEVREGRGSPNGGICYGRGRADWEPFEFVAGILFPNWKYKGLDLSELGEKLKSGETVEVGSLVEYFDGGIVVNERFETAVPGLYAAGECALGPFGSNRIAAAITEMLVHGADAGENAAAYAAAADARKTDAAAFDEKEEAALRPLVRPKGLRPAQVRRCIQEKAHKHLGPIRNGRELQAFVDFVSAIKRDELPQTATSSKGRMYNKEWVDALELESIVHLLEAAARSALFRTESRGVHYREDHPYTDNDNWLYESLVKMSGDDFEITKRPVTCTTITPPRGVVSYLDMMKKMMEAHSDVGGHH
ncbi:FAD-binding protein [Candidatus Poribacteria bacterium]|nr:FAD-binding protein [Candidatus Poribacteria bacterium]